MADYSNDWRTGYEVGYSEGGHSREADYFIALTDDPRFNWPDGVDATPQAVADHIADLADLIKRMVDDTKFRQLVAGPDWRP